MAVNEYYLKEESDRLVFFQKLSNYFETKFQVRKTRHPGINIEYGYRPRDAELQVTAS